MDKPYCVVTETGQESFATMEEAAEYQDENGGDLWLWVPEVKDEELNNDVVFPPVGEGGVFGKTSEFLPWFSGAIGKASDR